MTLYNRNGLEKPDNKRLRRNPPAYDKVPVEWDGEVRGPELPSEFDWHPRTEAWWELWRRTPQSMVMVDSDWEVMLATAAIHTKYWRGIQNGNLSPNGMTMLASELRRREDLYGGSYEARRQMKMEINAPKDDPAVQEKLQEKEIQKAVDYLEMLNKGVANNGSTE